MKKEILIITVLVSNIAFGAVLPVKNRVVREVDANKNNRKNLSDAVCGYLCSKGLERAAAERKTAFSLSGSEYAAAQMVQNILEHCKELKREDIVAYLGESALFNKRVNLSGRDDIIALLQSKKSPALSEEILQKAHELSALNKKLLLALAPARV